MSDKIDLTSGGNLFAATEPVANSAFATFDLSFSFGPTDETKEREIKERVDNIAEDKNTVDKNTVEELKIATPEEILEAKRLIVVNRCVKEYTQELERITKNVSIGTIPREYYNNSDQRKKYVKFPNANETIISNITVMRHVMEIYGLIDCQENYSMRSIDNYNNQYYSFRTTIQEDYDKQLEEVNKKRKLIEDNNNDVEHILREKRRRLA